MGIAERKERQRQQVRDAILAAAGEILAKEGFAGLTMRRIADAIEYSPAAIYLHFRSRDEIARELCRQGYQDLMQAVRPALAVADPLRRLAAISRAYIRFGFAQPAIYRLIFMEDPRYTRAVFEADTETGENPGLEAFAALTATADELKANGRVDARVETQLLAETWWAAVHGMVSLGLSCLIFPVQSVDEMVELVVRMLGRGLSDAEGQRS